MTTATKTPGILKKMLQIQRDLRVEKTGYNERNDYYYWKADDVAAAVRKGMNEVGVIHRVKLLDVKDDSRVDAQGRDRRRTTAKSRIIFVDPDDGSEFPHEVVSTGSDIGGDLDTRKVAVQAFKIAAVDLFVVAEGMDKLDSDAAPEAPPEDVSQKTAADTVEKPRTVRELGLVVGKVTKDPESGITGAMVKDAGVLLAKRAGIAEESTVWKKESKIMEPLVAAIEAAIESDDDTATAFKLATTGEVE